MPVRAAMLVLLVACGPGVGRPADVLDSGPRAEAGPTDAEVFPDAAPKDAGSGDVGLFLPDTGEVTRYPFSGVFGILNDNDLLFAREAGDRLMLIVGQFPYIYTGTIDAAGNVDTASAVLTRSGCALARISGTYDRVAAIYELRHQTCSALDGSPIESTIRGGFAQDYSGPSGVYELTATLIRDLGGCAPNNQPQPAKIGVNIRGGTISVFTADDLVAEPGVYIGRTTGNGSGFSATYGIDANNSQAFAMSGTFTSLNANEPINFAGQRDVYNPDGNCSFTVMMDGERSVAP